MITTVTVVAEAAVAEAVIVAGVIAVVVAQAEVAKTFKKIKTSLVYQTKENFLFLD
jgi:hypothetical protein